MIYSGQGAFAALDFLHPILSDADYFSGQKRNTIPPAMRLRIEQVLSDIHKQLEPVAPERLRQLITRLLLHFKCPTGEHHHRIFKQYIADLGSCPEDLLCAAYVHVVRHSTSVSLPPASTLQSFIQPEYERRHDIRRKLEFLLAQHVPEVAHG